MTSNFFTEAASCSSTDSLINLASEHVFSLTAEEANFYLQEKMPVELTHSEISLVARTADPCYKNRLCQGDSTCGGGRHWHQSIFNDSDNFASLVDS